MLDWLLFGWFEKNYWRDRRGGLGEGDSMTDRWW
jgi:hypothetical protein